MADDTSSRIGLEPLKGAENYSPWAVQMKDLLGELELWSYVTGDEVLTPTTEPTWKKKDGKALRQIRLRVARDLVALVSDADTSKEAWDTLKTTFRQSGTIGIITLRRKLYTLAMQEGGDIEDHLRSMREVRAELRALGDKVEDRDFSLAMLTSLPASWDSFIRSIDAEDLIATATIAAKITPTKLIARITQEANRTTARDGGDFDHALAVSDATCFRCGKRGHLARECRSNRRDDGRSRGEFSRARDHDRSSRSDSGRARATKDDEPASDTDEMVGYIAWMAREHDSTLAEHIDTKDSDSDGNKQPDVAFSATSGAWFFDSGATMHIACDLRDFSEYRATPGATITGIGGTSIPKVGEGTVKLTAVAGNKHTIITLTKVAHVPSASANLISVRRITSNSATVDFTSKQVTVRASNGNIILTGSINGLMFRAHTEVLHGATLIACTPHKCGSILTSGGNSSDLPREGELPDPPSDLRNSM